MVMLVGDEPMQTVSIPLACAGSAFVFIFFLYTKLWSAKTGKDIDEEKIDEYHDAQQTFKLEPHIFAIADRLEEVRHGSARRAASPLPPFRLRLQLHRMMSFGGSQPQSAP